MIAFQTGIHYITVWNGIKPSLLFTIVPVVSFILPPPRYIVPVCQLQQTVLLLEAVDAEQPAFEQPAVILGVLPGVLVDREQVPRETRPEMTYLYEIFFQNNMKIFSCFFPQNLLLERLYQVSFLVQF